MLTNERKLVNQHNIQIGIRSFIERTVYNRTEYAIGANKQCLSLAEVFA